MRERSGGAEGDRDQEFDGPRQEREGHMGCLVGWVPGPARFLLG
jgi:hypothetical protein